MNVTAGKASEGGVKQRKRSYVHDNKGFGEGDTTLWETGGFQKAWKQAVPLGHTDSTLKLQNTVNSALAKIQPVI